MDEGRTGAICTPFDAHRVAAACQRALQLVARPTTTQACRDAAARFDWDEGVAPWVERIYRGERLPADERPYG